MRGPYEQGRSERQKGAGPFLSRAVLFEANTYSLRHPAALNSSFSFMGMPGDYNVNRGGRRDVVARLQIYGRLRQPVQGD